MAHGLLAWLIIGAIAGWLAGVVVEGSGFGLIADIVIGIIGAVIGGFLTGALGISIGSGLVSSILVSVLGAVVLLVIAKILRRA